MTTLKIAIVSFCFIITGAALFNCGPQIPTDDGSSDVVSQDAVDSGNPDTIVQPDGSDANGDDHVVIPDSGDTDGGARVCSPSTTQPRPVCTTGMICQCVPLEDRRMPPYCQTATDAMAQCRASMSCDSVTSTNHCSPHLPIGVDGSTPFTCQDEVQFGVWVVAEDTASRETGALAYESDPNGLVWVAWGDAGSYMAEHESICLDKHCYTNRGISSLTSSSELAFSTDCRQILVTNYRPDGTVYGTYHINWVRRSF